jgi:L-threonylcarbamoyladenylate synthase
MWIDSRHPDQASAQRAADVIRAGGIVLYPTDTVYGLGCDPFNREAMKRLFRIKGRPEKRGVLVLVPGIEAVEQLAAGIPPSAREILQRFWPGPLTVILPAAPHLPPELTGTARTIGVRHPDQPFLQAWMDCLGGPIVSTSANRSGDPDPPDLESLRRLFESKVDLFLESGRPASRLPSTVIDLTVTPFELLREGDLTSAVRRFLAQLP